MERNSKLLTKENFLSADIRRFQYSVDIPSGLDATRGEVLGYCVQADKTVTFVAKKRGMALGDGSKYCDRVIVKDLGISL